MEPGVGEAGKASKAERLADYGGIAEAHRRAKQQDGEQGPQVDYRGGWLAHHYLRSRNAHITKRIKKDFP